MHQQLCVSIRRGVYAIVGSHYNRCRREQCGLKTYVSRMYTGSTLGTLYHSLRVNGATLGQYLATHCQTHRKQCDTRAKRENEDDRNVK